VSPAEVGDTRWAVAQLLVLAAALYAKGLVRPYAIQMSASIISSLILVFVITAPSNNAGKLERAIVAAALLLTAICTIVPFWDAFSQLRENYWWMARGALSCNPPPGLQRIRCYEIYEIGAMRGPAIRYVQHRTRPNDYLFVGAGRHDKIYVNDIAFYFAAARSPVTKWYHFDSGIQNTAVVQSEIIAALKDKRPPVIVLETQWDQVVEPNDSAQSSHVTLLDEFIRTAYRLDRTFGTIRVLKRLAD
jgi:hypothetical protein